MEIRHRRIAHALAVGACVVWLGTGGCHLFGDYESGADVDGELTDDAEPAPDTITRDTSEPVDSTTDTRVRDTRKPGEPDTDAPRDTDTGRADVSEFDTAEVAADGDASADQGLPPNQCPSSRPSYRVRPAAAGVDYAVDGVCNGDEYDHAVRLPTPSPGTVTNTGSNDSNNEASCHLVWFPDKQTFQGCCDVRDDDLYADTQPGDPNGKIWGEGDYDDDDRLEMWLKCDLGTSSRSCGWKFTVNNREGTSESGSEGGPPTLFDSKEGDESFDWVTDAWVVRDSGTGYALEWRADIPFGTQKGGTHACEFGILDVDRTGSGDTPELVGDIRPFNRNRSINDPEYWGCCFFE